MNVIGFSLFIFLSIVGIKRNLKSKRIGNIFFFLYYLFFILCGVSRIGHTEDYSDLTHYVSYFENDISTYFEPGYLFLTYILKTYISDSPSVLVIAVGLIILTCISIVTKVISSGEENNQYCINRFSYNFIIIAVYLTYWGLAFEAERLRIGVATSLILLSLVLVLYKKYLLPVVLCGLAITFQFTIVIMIPVLFLAGILERNNSISILNRNKFLLWFIILICIRLFFCVFGGAGPVVLVMSKLQTLISLFDLSHYEGYASNVTEGGNLITLKEIFYYVCGYFMIHHGSKYNKYNIIVLIYLLGLTLNVFLVGFIAGHRISDMFLSVNCVAIAYMGWLKIMSRKSFYLYLLAVIFSQSVMSINYLGLSL